MERPQDDTEEENELRPRPVTRTADRVTVAIYPLMQGCLGLGVLCGAAFILLGASAHVGWIEDAGFIGDLGLGWSVGGGLGMIVGAFGGMISVKEQRDAAAQRLGPS